jgi:hypothetical protein
VARRNSWTLLLASNCRSDRPLLRSIGFSSDGFYKQFAPDGACRHQPQGARSETGAGIGPPKRAAGPDAPGHARLGGVHVTVQTKLSVAKIQQLSVSLGMGNNGPDSVHSVQRSRFADVKLFSIIALSAIIVIVVYGNVVWRYSEQPEDAGLFGDSFGAVNALFSALAFAAVFVALRLQRLDLEEQKKELKETQKHIEVSFPREGGRGRERFMVFSYS